QPPDIITAWASKVHGVITKLPEVAHNVIAIPVSNARCAHSTRAIAHDHASRHTNQAISKFFHRPCCPHSSVVCVRPGRPGEGNHSSARKRRQREHHGRYEAAAQRKNNLLSRSRLRPCPIERSAIRSE